LECLVLRIEREGEAGDAGALVEEQLAVNRHVARVVELVREALAKG